MMLVRPVKADDVDQLSEMFTRLGERLSGMSSLRGDSDFLSSRVASSVDSFAAEVDAPSGETYFLVLEDSESRSLVGTAAIKAAVGLNTPFYTYKVSTIVYASRELGVYSDVQALFLTNDYTGCTELGSLFVDPDYRRQQAGKLVSLSRFLFMADRPQRFSDRVFAEMRGYQENASPPFWEAVGSHFFRIPFTEADELSAGGDKVFIAELMPKHPIYVPLLPTAAQEAIGKVHVNTRPARRLLEKEGFRHQGYVDIFDAGPTIESRFDDIRTIRDSAILPVESSDLAGGQTWWLIGNTRFEAFRATSTRRAQVLDDRILLHPEDRDLLELAEGDPVRLAHLDTSAPGRV